MLRMSTDIVTQKRAYDEWHARYPVDAEYDTPWHRWTQARVRLEAMFAGGLRTTDEPGLAAQQAAGEAEGGEERTLDV